MHWFEGCSAKIVSSSKWQYFWLPALEISRGVGGAAANRTRNLSKKSLSLSFQLLGLQREVFCHKGPELNVYKPHYTREERWPSGARATRAGSWRSGRTPQTWTTGTGPRRTPTSGARTSSRSSSAGKVDISRNWPFALCILQTLMSSDSIFVLLICTHWTLDEHLYKW